MDVMEMKWKLFFITIILLLAIAPVLGVNATEAQILYTRSFDGVAIDYVAMNSLGTVSYVGLENGSIVSVDHDNQVIYNVFVGDDIDKLVADDAGNIVYLTKGNRNGYILANGTIATSTGASATNVTDIDISHDGNIWINFTDTLTAGKIYVMNKNGGVLYSNTSVGTANWSMGGFDSVNGLIVAANTSNQSIYLFNFTNFTGWMNFNPNKLPKNSTLETLDSFPYRMNITANNGDSATWGIGLTPSTNPAVTTITKNSASEYSYNATNVGHYLLITNAFNVTIGPQSLFLNHSRYNSTSGVINLTFKPSGLVKCVTMYFGNPTYTNLIIDNNFTANNGTRIYENFTGTSSWTAPAGVTGINLTMYGGGAAGFSGNGSSKGKGGNNSRLTEFQNVAVTPGTSYSVVVGTGGWYGAPDGVDSSFNGVQIARGAYRNPGNEGGTGLNGNTTFPNYPTASDGGYGIPTQPLCQATNPPGPGGVGFGAGGGGGGIGVYAGDCRGPGTGGQGASGIVQISYFVNDITKYVVGTQPSSSSLSALQTEDVSSTMSFVSYIVLTGNVQSLFVPPGGGVVSVATASKVYSQAITPTGFTTQYSGNSGTGVSFGVKSANSNSFTIDARSLEADLYPLSMVQVGAYNTGGNLHSVDIAKLNGLYAVAGGDDGKMYIFQKDTASGFLVYYLGDSLDVINSVAVSDRGEFAIAGRNDGTFTYFNLQGTPVTSASSYTVDLFVHKGGSAYSGVNVTVTSGGTSLNGTTDSDGKYTFTVTDKEMYNIVVGANEGATTYTASTNYRIIQINIPNPLISTPYTYTASYNSTDHKITYTYQDNDLANVNVRIYDNTAKITVSNIDYLGIKTVNANYTISNTNHTYKVVFSFTRFNGAKYQDSKPINPTAGIGGAFANLPDQYKLFATFIYLFVVIAGFALTIDKLSIKPGMLVLAGMWDFGLYIGIIPGWNTPGGIALAGLINLICIVVIFKKGYD